VSLVREESEVVGPTSSSFWTIRTFGIDRTIYGSNFPLEKLHMSYEDFFGIYRKVMAEYTEAEQRAVFHDNAAKFYRL